MAFALPPLFSFLLVVLFLLPFSAVSQTKANISVGDSITASETSPSWTSPSGDFSFGFRQLAISNDLFLLSIWYDKIPDKTIVWSANGDSPAPRGSTVQFYGDRGLALRTPQGMELWSTNITDTYAFFGFMNDTGNFVLLGNNSRVVWASFNYPTDTMLPTQVLELRGVLSSRMRETDFSRGRFQFRLQEDGNVVLNSINLPTTYANDPYYMTGTLDASNSTNSGYRVIFDKDGSFYILRRSNVRQYLTPKEIAPAAENYYRATINFDGVFTILRHPKNSSGNWTSITTLPDNICVWIFGELGTGACGYNNICILKNDSRPTCKCPPKFSLVDPSDKYGNCKPDFIHGCEADGQVPQEELYDILELPNTDWPSSDYTLLEPFTAQQCKEACMQDCMCAVSIFRAGDKCWKKKLPLSNGKVDTRFYDLKAFLKVRKVNFSLDPLSPPGKVYKHQKKNQEGLVVVLSVLLASSVTAVCFLFFIIYFIRQRQVHYQEKVVETNLHCFRYKELEEATNGFKEELGRGAFGCVYKGTIKRDSYINKIAVKKLHPVVQDGEKEFKTEVNVIGQTHHKNLVRLLGFCEEGPQRLLVYEFLSNGTLASFLFGDLRPSWHHRVQIASGIARGLLYLHEECTTQIIHCDIKPQNILLDEYYNARISDFGLAKLLLLNQSHTHTAIRGTKGYVAPEWFRHMPITVKVDVYSFGVLLFEIICCQRSVDMEASETDKEILAYWAYDCYREGALDTLVKHDKEALDDAARLEKFLMVAIWCIQEDPSLRPTMRRVTQMLEGVVEIPVPPCPSPYGMAN